MARIDDLMFAAIPLMRSGILDKIGRLDKKMETLLQESGGVEVVGVIEIAVWCLVQECRGKVGRRGVWRALERIWEAVGEECGVEMT